MSKNITSAQATAQMPPIKISEKLGFSAFSAASNVVTQFRSMYYLFFLTNVLLLPVAWAGYIVTIGLFWDAVNDPIVGFWSVNHRFKNGERCRPFALWFALPWAVTMVLLFCNFGLNRTGTMIIALVCYLLFELFSTFANIPYNSMGGLATNADADRRSINVFRTVGAILGSGIGAVACLPLLRLFGGLDNEGNLVANGGSRGFLFVAIVMGVLCAVGCLAHYFTTKERVKPIGDDSEHLSIKRVCSMLIRSKTWVMNSLYILCYNCINLMLMTCITYYATYVLGSTGAATTILAVYLACALVSSAFVTPIDKALGRKGTMVLAAVVSILGKVWFIISPFSMAAMYANAITAAFAINVSFVMFNTNRNNLVDIIEWKQGRRLDSMVSTVDNLIGKMGTAAATLIITSLLSANGLNATLAAQPTSAINTINLFLGWVPMVISVLMLLVVCFLNIDREMKQMKEEKAANRLS